MSNNYAIKKYRIYLVGLLNSFLSIGESQIVSTNSSISNDTTQKWNPLVSLTIIIAILLVIFTCLVIRNYLRQKQRKRSIDIHKTLNSKKNSIERIQKVQIYNQQLMQKYFQEMDSKQVLKNVENLKD